MLCSSYYVHNLATHTLVWTPVYLWLKRYTRFCVFGSITKPWKQICSTLANQTVALLVAKASLPPPNSPQVMTRRDQSSLQRTLLVAAALLMVISHCHGHYTPKRRGIVPECYRVKKYIPTPSYVGSHRGCRPFSNTTRMWTCIGRCGSYDAANNTLLRTSSCNCCSSTFHQIKWKRIYYKCEGIQELQAVKYYYPIIRTCGCRQCDYVF